MALRPLPPDILAGQELLELLLLGVGQLGVVGHGEHGVGLQSRASFVFDSGGRPSFLDPVSVLSVGTGTVSLRWLQLSLRMMFHLVVVEVAGSAECLTTDVALIRLFSFRKKIIL